MIGKTAKSLSTLNRETDALYRAVYLREPLDHIAKMIGVKGKQSVRRILDRAEADDRVLRSVAMRMSAEERRMDREFEGGRK